MTILRHGSWRTNADLILDVARLGYLEGSVIDLTYGEGNFWKKYTPPDFTACDIDPWKSPLGYAVDCRHTPFMGGQFDVVVIDLPYRMGGTRDRANFDERYGTSVYESWQVTYQRIYDAIKEAARISRQRILLKCQDAVASKDIHWQTWDFASYAQSLGFYLEDRFDMVTNVRPQRSQKRTRSNTSSLLVLGRGRNYRTREPVIGHGSSSHSLGGTAGAEDTHSIPACLGTGGDNP